MSRSDQRAPNSPRWLVPATKIYLGRETVDLRKGFEGLFGLVRDYFGQDPLSGHLFLFTNRDHPRLKVLVWDAVAGVLWIESKVVDGPQFSYRRKGADLTLNLAVTNGCADCLKRSKKSGSKTLSLSMQTPQSAPRTPSSIAKCRRPPLQSASSLWRCRRVQNRNPSRRRVQGADRAPRGARVAEGCDHIGSGTAIPEAEKQPDFRTVFPWM